MYNKYLQRRRLDTAVMTQAKVQVSAMMMMMKGQSKLVFRTLAPGVLTIWLELWGS